MVQIFLRSRRHGCVRHAQTYLDGWHDVVSAWYRYVPLNGEEEIWVEGYSVSRCAFEHYWTQKYEPISKLENLSIRQADMAFEERKRIGTGYPRLV